LKKKLAWPVRERLISTLGTENIHPSCAAQCLAYIAVAELFPGTHSSSEITSLEDLLSELWDVVVQPANEHRKEAALETIDYICQEIVS
jgi:C4-type Zn-finger protein